MSEFIRRASDAFHRQRQGSAASTGSTDEPASPNAAKPPTQEPVKKAQSAPAGSQAKDTGAGTTATGPENVKQRRHWGWRNQQAKNPEAKQQPSQGQRDNDWVIGS
ncbi:hypothetical protein MYU51_015245 [Penicillium brevicompactum]|uniref:uncharacterized protein n=1 Tax=Penicillium brevicompactum TaxID=5074 RepID=UPI002541445B|nr:uncharacterized protein N7506_001651 [Penicillium brevicompactum]KAJ5348398.1 hypothetical protein N7506_001651 [Penicillium brevicompactum]